MESIVSLFHFFDLLYKMWMCILYFGPRLLGIFFPTISLLLSNNSSPPPPTISTTATSITNQTTAQLLLFYQRKKEAAGKLEYERAVGTFYKVNYGWCWWVGRNWTGCETSDFVEIFLMCFSFLFLFPFSSFAVFFFCRLSCSSFGASS